jgi:L-fuconolactonase
VSPWQEDLKRLGAFPNVCCKLSGMVTEARWKQWRADDFKRYLDIVLAAFGPDRAMIGSDWPVCTLSGEYVQTMGIVIDYAQQFPRPVCDSILGGACARFYGIKS